VRMGLSKQAATSYDWLAFLICIMIGQFYTTGIFSRPFESYLQLCLLGRIGMMHPVLERT